MPRNGTKLQDFISQAGKAQIKKFQSLESSPGLQVSGKKKIWVNSTFLWAANCDSVKVVKKSVKSGAKYHETPFAPVGREKNINSVVGSYDWQLDYVD